MPYQITNVLNSRKGPAKSAYKRDSVVKSAYARGRILIGRHRLKFGTQVTISDPEYKANKDLIDKYAKHGVIELLAIGGTAQVETPSPKKASSPKPPASLSTQGDSSKKGSSASKAPSKKAKESDKDAVTVEKASKAPAKKTSPAKETKKDGAAKKEAKSSSKSSNAEGS